MVERFRLFFTERHFVGHIIPHGLQPEGYRSATISANAANFISASIASIREAESSLCRSFLNHHRNLPSIEIISSFLTKFA